MIHLSEYEQQTLDKMKEGHTPEEQKKIENRFRGAIQMMRNSFWGGQSVYATTHFCKTVLGLSEHKIISNQPNP